MEYMESRSSQGYQTDSSVIKGNENVDIDFQQPRSIEDGVRKPGNSEEKLEDVKPICKWSVNDIKFCLLLKYNLESSYYLQVENYPDSICKSREMDLRNLKYLPDNCIARLSDNFSRKKQIRKQSANSNVSWKPCKQLKYYKQRSAAARAAQLTEPQNLNFRDKPFSTNGLPSSIPENIRNMKLEENRLRSFLLGGKESFQQFCNFIEPERLAANGFFYLQAGDRVKCAFCLGVLGEWQLGETPADAHHRHFSTCPMVLGLDVGNVALVKESNATIPTQCNEPCESSDNPWVHSQTDQYNWQQGTSKQFEQQWILQQVTDASEEFMHQMCQRSVFPVSEAVAKAATSKSILLNIEVLSRSLDRQRAPIEYEQKEPKFAEIDARFDTFAEDPLVPADQLADAGFFMNDGATECYWCGLRILAWCPGDDPWIEHSRWSPRCCHLLLNRGFEFVLASRALHPPYAPSKFESREAPALDASPASSTMLGASVVDYRIEQRHFKAREDLPASISMKELDFDASDVKTAQFLQLKSCGNDFHNSELLLSGVMRVKRERESRRLTAAEFNEQKVKDIEEQRNRVPKDLGDDEVNWRACKVCMDKVINVTLLECRHLCCCSICAKALQNCPVCRADIKALVYTNIE